MKLTFETDVNGLVASVSAPFEPTADPIVFKKKPDEKFYDPTFLKKLSGQYELLGQVISVDLKGKVLTMTIPGQPVYELVPVPGDEFTLKQVSVVRIRFIVDQKGEVSAMEVSPARCCL